MSAAILEVGVSKVSASTCRIRYKKMAQAHDPRSAARIARIFGGPRANHNYSSDERGGQLLEI